MSLNSETTPLNKPAQQQQGQKRSKWGSTCVTLALAINTVLLVGILVAIVGIRSRVGETLTKVELIVDAVESGKPSSSMLEFSNKLLSSATSYFFLGDFDGTIAGFLENVLLYDFAGFASQFVTFSQKAAVPFEGATDSISSSIVTALHAIRSIGSTVSQFQDVQGNAATNAALSTGIFQLNHMLEWIRSQADAQSWKDAGTVCTAFNTQLKSISWAGSYIDGNGNQKTWDIINTMQGVTDDINTVCGKLSQITP